MVVVVAESPLNVKLVLDFVDVESQVVFLLVLKHALAEKTVNIAAKIVLKLFDFLYLLTEHLLVHAVVHDLVQKLQADDLSFCENLKRASDLALLLVLVEAEDE